MQATWHHLFERFAGTPQYSCGFADYGQVLAVELEYEKAYIAGGSCLFSFLFCYEREWADLGYTTGKTFGNASGEVGMTY